ncbi:MAG: electron transport complex subunit RsxE [Candidatus Cloacimonadaceae bacterium]|jgi:Na+-transporting NADH:ubiquinone oxidoreductase subunit D|nr:electron transport complex subunit RsxE [Candidatus Cloacimonadota bacterium]MDY0128035.1 electron transport complex subunit RsxE [Candidatus Cloacimonadaceae bacterium]MCB5254545.1 electron transport complex subunit RsxE [Candidatus Cloacimonadota bacterium]MCK9178799.1 electron transport complex subunit RsxE [Candidatus Cloacimonadota bacterium]MCK9242462.1 electron transport complex subunit RsxE [Candidatus Cloacimonadota bacterium]
MTKKEIFFNATFKDNSIWRQILGICSALAVTNLMLNSLIMGLGVIFTLAMANMTISLIRNWTPRSVRMMLQVLIIASYVIIVDIFLKANMPQISKQLGPYVGLIITNCILMGRAEAFASKNKVLDSLIDGIGTGIGYTLVLLLISLVRELFGFGSVFGFRVFGDWWTDWSIMVMAPSAFFILAMLIWIVNTYYYKVKA